MPFFTHLSDIPAGHELLKHVYTEQTAAQAEVTGQKQNSSPSGAAAEPQLMPAQAAVRRSASARPFYPGAYNTDVKVPLKRDIHIHAASSACAAGKSSPSVMEGSSSSSCHVLKLSEFGANLKPSAPDQQVVSALRKARRCACNAATHVAMLSLAPPSARGRSLDKQRSHLIRVRLLPREALTLLNRCIAAVGKCKRKSASKVKVKLCEPTEYADDLITQDLHDDLERDRDEPVADHEHVNGGGSDSDSGSGSGSVEVEDRHKSNQSMTWEQYDNQALSFAVMGRGSLALLRAALRWLSLSDVTATATDGATAAARSTAESVSMAVVRRFRRALLRAVQGPRELLAAYADATAALKWDASLWDGEQCMRWLDLAGVRRLAPRAVAAMELLAQPAPPPVLGLVADGGDTRLNGEKLLELGCGYMVLRCSASAHVRDFTNSLQRTQRVGADSEGAGAMLPSVIDSSSFDADSSRVLFDEYGMRGSLVRQRMQFHLRVLKILSLWNAHYVARLQRCMRAVGEREVVWSPLPSPPRQQHEDEQSRSSPPPQVRHPARRLQRTRLRRARRGAAARPASTRRGKTTAVHQAAAELLLNAQQQVAEAGSCDPERRSPPDVNAAALRREQLARVRRECEARVQQRQRKQHPPGASVPISLLTLSTSACDLAEQAEDHLGTVASAPELASAEQVARQELRALHELLRDTYRQVANMHSDSPRENEHALGSNVSDPAPKMYSAPVAAPATAIALEDLLGERHERERDTQRRVKRRQRGIGDLYERGVNARRKRDDLVEVQRREREERETAHSFAPRLCAKQLPEVLALRSRPHTLRPHPHTGKRERENEGDCESAFEGGEVEAWSKSK